MQPPSNQTIQPTHVYEVRPSKDHRGANLISDALLFGRLWYAEGNAIANAIGYAKHRSRSDRAVIRVYDAAGNVIATHEHAGDFKES
jgi:anti-sigma factor ChrR (cupin superfamily)